MNLQELFYGAFTPPPVASTRHVYMDGNPPAQLRRDKQKSPGRNSRRNLIGRKLTADYVVPWLKLNPGSSIDDITDGTGLRRKAIATAMPRLMDSGLVERAKGRRKDGKMSVYLYWSLV